MAALPVRLALALAAAPQVWCIMDLTGEINAITLVTHDIAESERFYGCLGLRQTFRSDNFSTFSIGGHNFLNLQLVNHKTEAKAWGRPIIYVTSVDDMYSRVLACGRHPEFPPTNACWGERYFHVIEPAGHELSFAKPLHARSAIEDR